jgi:hypothetical protein
MAEVRTGNKTASNVSQELLAESTRRNWFFIYNNGTGAGDFCWLLIGEGSAENQKGIPLPAGGFFETPFIERDRIGCKRVAFICPAGTPVVSFHTL